jgi:hypothetical protein
LPAMTRWFMTRIRFFSQIMIVSLFCTRR